MLESYDIPDMSRRLSLSEPINSRLAYSLSALNYYEVPALVRHALQLENPDAPRPRPSITAEYFSP